MIYGYAGDDYIDGGGGDDTIDPGLGDDVVYGGAGDDTIVGEANSPDEGRTDTYHGGSGNDYLAGTVSGTFFLYGEDGNDTLWGGENDDFLDGGVGNDFLYGDEGSDRLLGGAGDDTLRASGWWENGVDELVGGLGNDNYYFYGGDVPIIESYNEGIDTIYSDVSFQIPENIENMYLLQNGVEDYFPEYAFGNSLGNVIWGNAGPNQLYGFGGDDTLYGGDGNDRMDGGSGADTLRGEAGHDNYYVDNKNDKVIETAANGGTDTVYSTITYTLATYVESLQLTGSAKIDGTGSALANQIAGNSFANTLRGLGGNDTFLSGGGADVVIGGTGNDVFRYLGTIGSSTSARDLIRAGDGAVAFEKAGAGLGDRIDLSQIDANETAAGVQHFAFGTTTGAGRLWVAEEGSLTLIRGNTDGDAAPEFEIAIDDGAVRASAYTGVDFILT